MGVGPDNPPNRPGKISFKPRPKTRRTARTFRHGGRLVMLALVETSGPVRRHSRATGGWAETRTARLPRPPCSHFGTFLRTGNTQVTGPGQVASTLSMILDAGRMTNGSN